MSPAMSSFRIRNIEPRDLPAIAAQDPARPWLVDELAGDPAGYGGVVVEHRGAVVGCWAARRLPVVVRGDRLDFGVMAACFLAPEYRTGGLHSVFVEADEAFESEWQGREPGRFACVVGRFAESDWWTLRRLRGFAPIRTETDLFAADARALRVPASSERAVALDDDACARWIAPLVPGDCAVVRDGARMRVRRGRAGTLLAVLRDGAPAACAVVSEGPPEPDGTPARDVRDWCVAEDDASAAAALLAAAVDGATGAVRFPVFARSPWALELQRAGFRVRPSTWGGTVEPYLAARSSHPRCDPEWLAENWFATGADVCRYPMGVCQNPETVVTAPPAGTRSGAERHA
jgi:hypothetical protein